MPTIGVGYKLKLLHDLRLLWEGAAFGERALIYRQPRSASIKSVSTVHLATLDSANFRAGISEALRQRMNKQIEFLYQFSFFKPYSRSSL